MNSGHICMQCSNELQRDPTSRAKKEGRRRYEIRDMLISPVEIRCVRCHRRLALNGTYYDTGLKPIVGILGQVFLRCESIYGGVKGVIAYASDRQQVTEERTPSRYAQQSQQQHTQHAEAASYEEEAPPAYDEVVGEHRRMH